MTRALLAALACLLPACTTLVPPPDVDLCGLDPQAEWATVLELYVDERGGIDFERLAADTTHLDSFVAWIARERNPSLSGDEELACWINAYNALAMYNVLNAGVLPSSKVRFFYLRELVQDGAPISLYDFENDVIRARGEARVHFALNCMVRSCPRLPRIPFRAEDLNEQLDAAAREFLNDPCHVELVPERRTVRFSAILDWYEEDFLIEEPSLVAYANRYREEKIPADWDVEFLPYDWTLNQIHRP